MNLPSANKKDGFTIIEVVLVLAIAGLIFLIVFLAVPALQRSQRDTQRRNDMSRFMAQIQNYQSNNKGQVPTDAATGAGTVGDFVTRYMIVGGDTWEDPTTGAQYTFQVGNTPPTAEGTYQYTVGATCNGENVSPIAGNRKVAVQTKLEGGAIYCTSN